MGKGVGATAKARGWARKSKCDVWVAGGSIGGWGRWPCPTATAEAEGGRLCDVNPACVGSWWTCLQAKGLRQLQLRRVGIENTMSCPNCDTLR
jgi:hypothetical protein